MTESRVAQGGSARRLLLLMLVGLGAVLALAAPGHAGLIGNLAPTLEWQMVNGVAVPVQSGSPVPDFEPQEHEIQSLAGVWKKERVNVDHDLSFAERTAEGIAAIEAEGGGRHRANYDDSGWATKKLPRVEDIMPGDEESSPVVFSGGIWYRRTVNIPTAWAERTNRLICLGASYIFDLWINGVYVGVHEGGYTPFAFDVTDYLDYGAQNVIAVRIDKPFPGVRQDAVPSWVAMDWWDYGGIIQDIYLDSAPALHVVRTNIYPRDYNGTLEVQVVVANDTDSPASAAVELQPFHADPEAEAYFTDPRPAGIIGEKAYLEGQASQVVNVPANGMAVAVFGVRIIAPERWTPREPNLYVLHTRVAAGENSDDHYNQFGIRTVGVANHHVMFNGRVAFFPGASRHEEWPDTGRTATWDRIWEDLEITIDDLNALFLRTGHYPNHPYTYLVTDRLGLAVMEEIPVYWFFPWNWAFQNTRRIADQMFREMVLAGANRPSIMFWSLSNECPFLGAYANTAYNQRVADDYHQNINDGRLLTQSPAADSWRLSLMTQEPLDVAGWTTYYGIFYDGETMEDMYEGTRQFILDHAAAAPDLPIVSTEYGSWSESDDSAVQWQIDTINGTFPAFAETAALDADGKVRPEGYVAAVTWFSVFNWFTKNGLPEFIAPYLQTMGVIHMDRAAFKPGAEVLRQTYAPYFEFGGLGPEPDDYVDEEEPTDDDDDNDDNDDDDTTGTDDGDNDDENGCGC
jgi:beta-glucuronidase